MALLPAHGDSDSAALSQGSTRRARFRALGLSGGPLGRRAGIWSCDSSCNVWLTAISPRVRRADRGREKLER
jgi:hypothetical protein